MNTPVIEVLYPTHGSQSGSQVQFDPSTHTWTVWNKRGLERTFRNVTSYVRYMTKGWEMATIDITEQALGTQSATLKIDYLEKARTFENKHFMILSVKMPPKTGHQVILKT